MNQKPNVTANTIQLLEGNTVANLHDLRLEMVS